MAGTTRSFQSMLNEYLPDELLKEEMLKRDYILQNVKKDNNWKGGKRPVPFQAAGATSVKFGALTADTDIAQAKYVRGSIDDYVEVWGSMIFNQRDLMEHDGKIPESTFLRILPDQVNDFMQYMKEVVSIQLGTGPHFAKVTDATNAATGILIVDKIDRFQIDQKAILDDDNSVTLEVYVIAININTKAVTVSATRGGAAADVSAYSVAQNAKFYHDGVWDGSTLTTFISMRQAFLSAANGGSTTLHGQTKTAYPILQAYNHSGASMTASNVLDVVFDAWTEYRSRAKGGQARTVLMSYKHLGSVMKQLEIQKGAFRVTKEASVNIYGWTEIEITTVKGSLMIVGLQEMDDDVMPIVDWSSITFLTNGFFRKNKSPEGLEYFVKRATTGYQYIVDSCLFGEMEFKKPAYNAIIHSISY